MFIMRDMKDPLEKAIEHAGGLTEFAKLLEVSPQVVSNWRVRGVPIDRCADIERVTGGVATRADFYPEHFGPIDVNVA